jgi:hypothetical protein
VLSSVLLAALSLFCATASFAQEQRVAPSATDLDRAISRYYEKPVDIPHLLSDWEKSGVGGRDAMMGFLAGIFAKQPEQIKIVTAATFGRQTQAAVIQGLRLADRHADAVAAAKSWGWPQEQITPITPVTPLRQAKVSHPSSFDVLWAASFATGDPAYVRPIYDYYESVASLPGVDVRDLVSIVMLRHRPNKEAMEALKNKYPQDAFMRVVFASSALWSLDSNARQHKFVAAALNGFQNEKAGSPASAGLADMRKASDEARGSRR